MFVFLRCLCYLLVSLYSGEITLECWLYFNSWLSINSLDQLCSFLVGFCEYLRLRHEPAGESSLLSLGRMILYIKLILLIFQINLWKCSSCSLFYCAVLSWKYYGLFAEEVFSYCFVVVIHHWDGVASLVCPWLSGTATGLILIYADLFSDFSICTVCSLYWFICPRLMAGSISVPSVSIFWQKLQKLYLHLLCFYVRYILSHSLMLVLLYFNIDIILAQEFCEWNSKKIVGTDVTC